MKRLQSIERRTEARQPVEGEVQIRQPGALSGPFLGHLIDASPTGFRIRHNRLTLAAGQLVGFQWAGQSGQAQAMWTRIAGEEAETGFHILHSDT
jgi:hypothetical protein